MSRFTLALTCKSVLLHVFKLKCFLCESRVKGFFIRTPCQTKYIHKEFMYSIHVHVCVN